MTHFLQSPAWAAFQEKLGRTVITRAGDGWSYLAIVEQGTGNTRLYCPYGPVVSDKKSFQAAIASLRGEAVRYKATFLRIEPTSGLTETALRAAGFREVSYQHLNPSRTQIIDLSPSRETILAAMRQNTRNLTRNYAKKGITITTSHNPDDITLLTSLLARVARRNRITTHSERYYQAQAEALFPIGAARLYLAHYNNQLAAASLIYDDADTRYYAHAAADDQFRKLSVGTALVGQMILDAKDNGQSSFDLYGIAPDHQPEHPWAGFTKFKQSFGGTPIDYLGSWDLPLRQPSYAVYRAYQTLRATLKK